MAAEVTVSTSPTVPQVLVEGPFSLPPGVSRPASRGAPGAQGHRRGCRPCPAVVIVSGVPPLATTVQAEFEYTL